MYMATSACTDGVARLGLYSAICLSPLDVDQYANPPRSLRLKGDGLSVHRPTHCETPVRRCLRQVDIARPELVCQCWLVWSRSVTTSGRLATSLRTWRQAGPVLVPCCRYD